MGLLREMQTEGQCAYITAMKACGNTGRWENALELLTGMQKEGIALDKFTYGIAMNACGAVGSGRWHCCCC